MREHGVEAPSECLGCGWAFNDKKIIVLPFEPRSREIRGTGPKSTAIDLVTLKVHEWRSRVLQAHLDTRTGHELR